MIGLGLESIFTQQIIYVKRKEKSLVVFLLTGGILNVIFKVILVTIGLLTPITAAATTIIAHSIMLLQEYIYIRKVLKVKFNPFNLARIKYFLISLVFIPIILLIRQLVSSIILIFLLSVLINASLYFIVLYVQKDYVLEVFLGKMREKLKGSFRM